MMKFEGLKCEVCGKDLRDITFYRLQECNGWVEENEEWGEEPDQTADLVYACSEECLAMWLQRGRALGHRLRETRNNT